MFRTGTASPRKAAEALGRVFASAPLHEVTIGPEREPRLGGAHELEAPEQDDAVPVCFA